MLTQNASWESNRVSTSTVRFLRCALLLCHHTTVDLHSVQFITCIAPGVSSSDGQISNQIPNIHDSAVPNFNIDLWLMHIFALPCLKWKHTVNKYIDAALTSRSCTRCCTAGYHGTCRAIVHHLRRKSPTTVVSTCLHLLCHGPELVWVTDHLLLPDHRYWTVCRQIVPSWQLCSL